jgi:hypothetical protein
MGLGVTPFLTLTNTGNMKKMLAWRKLKADLDDGRRSGEQDGWIPAKEVRASFEKRYCG